jgi:DsbC/DsbD-like thiol-disulfide interchange protein
LPLTLKLEAPAQLKIGKILYPAPDPEPARLGGSAENMQVYRGTILLAFALSAPAAVDPGEHEIKGTLTYQACDAKRCMPAARIPVELVVTIRKPPEK